MVTIKEVKKVENNLGEEFFGLIVQSGAMPVKSKSTGKIYLTAKTAFLPTTFDEETASSLVGSQLDGTVKKVISDPYDYTIEETGEVIQMTYRWEYVDETLEIIEKQVVQEASVF